MQFQGNYCYCSFVTITSTKFLLRRRVLTQNNFNCFLSAYLNSPRINWLLRGKCVLTSFVDTVLFCLPLGRAFLSDRTFLTSGLNFSQAAPTLRSFRLIQLSRSVYLPRMESRSNIDSANSYLVDLPKLSFCDTVTAKYDSGHGVHGDRLNTKTINDELVKFKVSEDQHSTFVRRPFTRSSRSCQEFEPSNGEQPEFQPKKILLLSKLTRLDFERRVNPDLNDDQLAKLMKERGSDFTRLETKRKIHNSYLNTIIQELTDRKIEYKVVHQWDYTEENIEWADAVMTAGGDGTFLLAASKIRDRQKPVIGINTDPAGSEGYLCLLRKLPEEKFSHAFDRLFRGDFTWLWRQRIRVTLSGKHAFEQPIGLHDQQLTHPEYRWSEHIREAEDPAGRWRRRNVSTSSSSQRPVQRLSRRRSDSFEFESAENRLPFLALNEVFIGESLSSRVSYYELQLDGNDWIKQKSSGLTVCTGTGSTSWYFNINKLTDQCVNDLITIINEDLGTNLTRDSTTVSRLCRRFNEQLIFSPSDRRMAFCVRDPVFNATYKETTPRGFANRVTVRSRCYDAHLVIDGGISYIFNDGAQVTLEILPNDALRTVIFR